MQLKEVGRNIWTYEGETVDFYGFPYTTRMTVVRLNNGALWIHSPERLNAPLQEELGALGRVAHLISPNKLHHLFLEEWIAAYPDALCYAAPGLAKKRKDIRFTKELSDTPDEAWAGEIEQLIFRGSPLMEEVVFFHTSSKTLLLTDLIENFRAEHFSGWKRAAARVTGIIYPHGKTPLDWRLSFVFGKAKARQSLQRMLAWEPENVVISHGECIFGQGTTFLKESFSWL